MPTDIHSPVQYANDRDFTIPQKIVDHMGPYGIFEIAVADVSRAANFQTGCQSLESLDDFGMVDLGCLTDQFSTVYRQIPSRSATASGERPYLRGLFTIGRAHSLEECGVIEGSNLPGFLTGDQRIL